MAMKEEAKPDARSEKRGRRRSPLAWMRYHLPQHVHRPVIRAARRVGKTWGVNSGDWLWMSSKPMPLKGLNRSLWRSAEPTLSYYVMLLLSGIISSLGLLAGSAAAIIGAMIVASLMGPITAMAFAITMGNRRLLKRSLLSVISGALLTVATAYLICTLVGLNTLNPEILARTRPILIDLAIGLAAGAAGSFATTRKDISSALPGVAIAVALVPPLSVIGIGLVFESKEVITGSTLLFVTNLAGIILSGGLIFIWQDYGSLKRAKSGLSASIVVLGLLGIPLGLSMRDLIVEQRTRTLVGSLLRQETKAFDNADVRRLQVDSKHERLTVYLEVFAPLNSISEAQISQVHQFLESKLEKPITLNVSIFPVQAFSIQDAP